MPVNRKCVERQDQWSKECQEIRSAWKDKSSGGHNARKQEVRGKTRLVEGGMPGNRKCVERQDQWRKECQETGSAWKDKTSGRRNARKQ